ncbi:MAG: hypothetical protein VCA36_10470 [Opitutales bacterium]
MKIIWLIGSIALSLPLLGAERWSVGKTVVFLFNQECNLSFYGIQSGLSSFATTYDYLDIVYRKIDKKAPIQVVLMKLEQVLNQQDDLGIERVYVYKPDRLANIVRNAHLLHSSVNRFWINKTPVDAKQLKMILTHSPSLTTFEIWSSKTGIEVLPVLAQSEKLKKVTINFTKISKEDFQKVKFRKEVAIEVQYPWPNGKGYQRWHRNPGQNHFKFMHHLSSPKNSTPPQPRPPPGCRNHPESKP